MLTLESQIDDLYALPLGDFVAARTALAKTRRGTDAKRVKTLPKPTVVPWAVNQLYWHARDAYERLVMAGEQLRAAQVAALEGKKKGKGTDVQGATDAHRAAVSAAAAAAWRLAARGGVNPNLEDVRRMLEALSLAVTLPEPAGRFTTPLAPAGFEALAGVVVKAVLRPIASPPREESRERPILAVAPRADAEQEKARRRQRELADRRKAAAIEMARAAATKAQTAEVQAREAWHRAKRALDDAERALRLLRSQ